MNDKVTGDGQVDEAAHDQGQVEPTVAIQMPAADVDDQIRNDPRKIQEQIAKKKAEVERLQKLMEKARRDAAQEKNETPEVIPIHICPPPLPPLPCPWRALVFWLRCRIKRRSCLLNLSPSVPLGARTRNRFKTNWNEPGSVEKKKQSGWP